MRRSRSASGAGPKISVGQPRTTGGQRKGRGGRRGGSSRAEQQEAERDGSEAVEEEEEEDEEEQQDRAEEVEDQAADEEDDDDDDDDGEYGHSGGKRRRTTISHTTRPSALMASRKRRGRTKIEALPHHRQSPSSSSGTAGQHHGGLDESGDDEGGEENHRAAEAGAENFVEQAKAKQQRHSEIVGAAGGGDGGGSGGQQDIRHFVKLGGRTGGTTAAAARKSGGSSVKEATSSSSSDPAAAAAATTKLTIKVPNRVMRGIEKGGLLRKRKTMEEFTEDIDVYVAADGGEQEEEGDRLRPSHKRKRTHSGPSISVVVGGAAVEGTRSDDGGDHSQPLQAAASNPKSKSSNRGRASSDAGTSGRHKRGSGNGQQTTTAKANKLAASSKLRSSRMAATSSPAAPSLLLDSGDHGDDAIELRLSDVGDANPLDEIDEYALRMEGAANRVRSNSLGAVSNCMGSGGDLKIKIRLEKGKTLHDISSTPSVVSSSQRQGAASSAHHRGKAGAAGRLPSPPIEFPSSPFDFSLPSSPTTSLLLLSSQMPSPPGFHSSSATSSSPFGSLSASSKMSTAFSTSTDATALRSQPVLLLQCPTATEETHPLFHRASSIVAAKGSLTAEGWTEGEFTQLKGELSRISVAHQKLLKQVEKEIAKLTYWDDNHPNMPVLIADAAEYKQRKKEGTVAPLPAPPLSFSSGPPSPLSMLLVPPPPAETNPRDGTTESPSPHLPPGLTRLPRSIRILARHLVPDSMPPSADISPPKSKRREESLAPVHAFKISGEAPPVRAAAPRKGTVKEPADDDDEELDLSSDASEGSDYSGSEGRRKRRLRVGSITKQPRRRKTKRGSDEGLHDSEAMGGKGRHVRRSASEDQSADAEDRVLSLRDMVLARQKDWGANSTSKSHQLSPRRGGPERESKSEGGRREGVKGAKASRQHLHTATTASGSGYKHNNGLEEAHAQEATGGPTVTTWGTGGTTTTSTTSAKNSSSSSSTGGGGGGGGGGTSGGGGGGGGGVGGDSGAGGGGGAGEGAGDDDDKRDEYIDGGGRRQRKNKRQARGRRRGRPADEDSGAEEEEDLRIKESELHAFWKSMLPYFAPIEEEDLKLLMPQPENDDSYWRIPRLGRYYREVWAEEDGEILGAPPAPAATAASPAARPKPKPSVATPLGTISPSAVGGKAPLRTGGMGTALTKQKVANIRKRMQKRKGKRKANSDDDYVFSAEEMESEEDTGIGGDMESEIINDLAGEEGVDMGDLVGFSPAEDVYNFTDDDDDFVAGKRPGKGKGKGRVRPLNGGEEGAARPAKRKRDQFIAGGEMMGGDVMSTGLGLDATSAEGDTSSRADDPTSMPSLTGDFTTRLLSALMEENIVFPPPYSTTAPYLPGGPEAGMNESGGGQQGLGAEWTDAAVGSEGGANGFGGGSVYSDTEETQGEEKAKLGGKGGKGVAGKTSVTGTAGKGPKAKQQQAMKAKSEASLKSLSSGGFGSGSGSYSTTSTATNTTAPVPLAASASAITAKKTPWGTITDVPAIPVRQLPVDYSQANYLSLEERLKLELRSIGLLSDADVDPRTREDDELCAEIRFLRLKLKQQLAQNNQRRSHLYQKALAKIKEQKQKEQQDIIDRDIERRFLRFMKNKKKQKGKK